MSIQIKTSGGLQKISEMAVRSSGGDEIEEVALTDFISMNTNFSLSESSVYKQGKHIFGNIIVKKSSNYGSSSDVVGTINSGYRPAKGLLPVCVLGADEWNSASVGYCYITTEGALRIADQVSSNKKAAKVHIDYVTP